MNGTRHQPQGATLPSSRPRSMGSDGKINIFMDSTREIGSKNQFLVVFRKVYGGCTSLGALTDEIMSSEAEKADGSGD